MNGKTDRYRALMTMGIQVTCPKCGFVETDICPKATGWSPYVWEMNCLSCYRFNANAYNAHKPQHRVIHDELRNRFEDFLEEKNLGQLDTQMNELAARFDALMDNPRCECGGIFSIAAKPRCKQCNEIIFDSYFHYA
jgi:hypothetical protein